MNTYSDLLLVAFDVLLQISLGAVGGIKGDLQFVNVLLQLLPDPHGLSLTLGLSLQTSLHGIKGTLVVASSVVEFLFFLLETSVNLGSDSGDLKLSTHDFSFLLLKRAFSLFQSSLELLFFHLKTALGLLDLVHTSSALTELVGEFVDLVGEILVLASEGLNGVDGFLELSLQSEGFSREAAGFFVGVVNLNFQTLHPALPFLDGLVVSSLFFLQVVCIGVGLNVNRTNDKMFCKINALKIS